MNLDITDPDATHRGLLRTRYLPTTIHVHLNLISGPSSHRIQEGSFTYGSSSSTTYVKEIAVHNLPVREISKLLRCERTAESS
jgi:hypothetical protein